MLRRMTPRRRRAPSRISTSGATPSRVSTMSAATMVAPVPPCTAIPTSASARAAASFTPSPTITTAPARPASAVRPATMSRLPSGVRPPSASPAGRPRLRGDARHDVGVVAREDPHAHAARAQLRNRPRGIRAKGVADAGHACDAPVHGDEHGAEAIGDGGRGERREIVGGRCPFGLDVRPVPHADVAAVQPAGDALARDLDHVLNRPHDPDRLARTRRGRRGPRRATTPTRGPARAGAPRHRPASA